MVRTGQPMPLLLVNKQVYMTILTRSTQTRAATTHIMNVVSTNHGRWSRGAKLCFDNIYGKAEFNLAWKQNIIDQPDNGIICSFILFPCQFWKLPFTALNRLSPPSNPTTALRRHSINLSSLSLSSSFLKLAPPHLSSHSYASVIVVCNELNNRRRQTFIYNFLQPSFTVEYKKLLFGDGCDPETAWVAVDRYGRGEVKYSNILEYIQILKFII